MRLDRARDQALRKIGIGAQRPAEADHIAVTAGQGVPHGQVSLAVEVELQPQDKSFTDAELKAVADKVVAAAAKLGAALRG